MTEFRAISVDVREWRPRARSPFLAPDRIFVAVLTVLAGTILLLAGLIVVELWLGAADARRAFGFGFVTSTDWDPVNHVFGALPYVYGTIATSLVAVLLAAPVGIATAIFLVEMAPRRMRASLAFLVELLAAIPSVVYGLWALFVLVPIVRQNIEPLLRGSLGFLPLFQGPTYGVGILAASLVLAIMVLPTVTAISRDSLAAVPLAQREAAYALGATRWEVIFGAVLPFARSGLVGAIILGLGRALGETMAVTMVIGNRGAISSSLFSLGDTMASAIANQFTEADSKIYTSALVEIGLLLFAVTVLLNAGARLLVWRIRRGAGAQGGSR